MLGGSLCLRGCCSLALRLQLRVCGCQRSRLLPARNHGRFQLSIQRLHHGGNIPFDSRRGEPLVRARPRRRPDGPGAEACLGPAKAVGPEPAAMPDAEEEES
jgi:hypothetical protein